MKTKPRAGPLAIELAVVVLGVLIALAADSWWEGRVEAQRAAAYLDAVEADMSQAEVDLEASVASTAIQRDQVRDFNAALEGTAETLRSVQVPWSALSGGPRLIVPTGTLDALLSTGDLNLLPEQVRVSIVRENAAIQSRLEQVSRFNDVLQEAYNDFELAYHEMVVAGEASPGIRTLTAVDIAGTPAMRHAWSRFELAYFNHLVEKRGILAAVKRVRAAVAAARTLG